MKLFICIYNEKTHEIEFPEEYPIDTPEETAWAHKNSERLGLECACRGGSDWNNYYSEDGPFEWVAE